MYVINSLCIVALNSHALTLNSTHTSTQRTRASVRTWQRGSSPSPLFTASNTTGAPPNSSVSSLLHGCNMHVTCRLHACAYVHNYVDTTCYLVCEDLHCWRLMHQTQRRYAIVTSRELMSCKTEFQPRAPYTTASLIFFVIPTEPKLIERRYHIATFEHSSKPQRYGKLACCG